MLPVPVPTTTTTTTTTTPYPVVVETRRPHSRRPVAPIVPATPITPVATVRAPARRRRPQSNVVATRLDSRFENRLEDTVDVTEPSVEDEEARLYREEQARNAHYSFGSSIDDTINDHSIHRQETRNGLALKGMYSYSDGFYKRTIHYEADENGYRVVKWVAQLSQHFLYSDDQLNCLWFHVLREEIEPIGEGPQYNPDGRADVATSLHGSQMKYTITADDFVRGRDTPVTTPKKTDHHRFSQRVRQ